MKRSEKRLLIVFGVMAALVFFVRLLPLALDYYQQGRDDIARLQKRAANYRSLIVDTAQWQQREQLKNAEVKDLESWVFPGTDPNLVSSSMQRSVRQLFAENSVELRQAGVPRYSYVGKWLVVEQDMEFSLSQSAILPVLRAIDAARPRLHVAAFKINRNRRAYSGNVTVVGFARAADKGSATATLPSAAARSAAPVSPAASNPFARTVKP